jgi:hypothetical protein
MHPPPSTIAPGSLTGDLPRRGRPPPRRGPAIPSALRPNWPYHRDPLPPPVPCHHSTVIEPGPRRRTAADLTGGRTPTNSPPCHPLLASSASPLWHVGPRRSPAGGPSGPHAHAAARARARVGQIPPSPAQLAKEISFPFLFPFYFPIFYIYVYILIFMHQK